MTPWRTWHLMERDDGSVSLYYVRPGNATHHVVYDTLDTPTPSLLARAEAAEAEIETVHVYMDECLIGNPDQGRSVPLIDRCVLLVSFLTRDHEVEALSRRADAAEAEVARLREARAKLSEVYNAFGYTWPQSFVEDVGAFLETSDQDAA